MVKLFTSIVILILTFSSLLILEDRKTFDFSTLIQIDPIPHTKELIHEKKYVEAQEYLSFFMEQPYVKNNPQSSKILNDIKRIRNSYDYKKDKVIEGVLEGKSDDNIGKTSALISDFLVIGDIRDLSIQGMHYFNNEKVDNFMVALSSLGLIATASTIYSGGTTAPIKTSVSVLKYGKKIKKIPLWFESKLIDSVKVVKKTKSLTAIEKMLEPIKNLYNRVGLDQSLYMLKMSKNSKELLHLAKFGSRFGKNSRTLLKITNNKALTYASAMPKVKPKTFITASTYGEDGLKALKKVGENRFLKRVSFNSHIFKSIYKGNFNPLLNYLLKNIPNWLLFSTVFLGLFYFMRKFFSLVKRII